MSRNCLFSRRSRNASHRGFTLTELAIVLGVIGVILGAIWVAASTVTANQKAEKMSQEIATIVGNMRATFPTGSFDVGATTFGNLPVNSGIIPILMPCASGNWGAGYGGSGSLAGICGGTPYGVQLLVGSQNGWQGASVSTTNFEIMFGNLTAAQCQSWMPGFVQSARANGLVWAYSPATGIVPITSATPISAFQTCSGVVILQFSL